MDALGLGVSKGVKEPDMLENIFIEKITNILHIFTVQKSKVFCNGF
jgi:hypothetical protein